MQFKIHLIKPDSFPPPKKNSTILLFYQRKVRFSFNINVNLTLFLRNWFTSHGSLAPSPPIPQSAVNGVEENRRIRNGQSQIFYKYITLSLRIKNLGMFTGYLLYNRLFWCHIYIIYSKCKISKSVRNNEEINFRI